jgi:hypothetical protein
MHEFIHGVFANLNVEVPDEKQEVIVQQTAIGICEALESIGIHIEDVFME